MRSQRFDDPRLFVVKSQELPLSGQALLELMREVLARDFPFRFCARGWSMAPFIRDGDVITVTPLQRTLPTVGEVVAFVHPGVDRLVVHRVVGRSKTDIFIQGDNVPEFPDGVIPEEALLGRITRIERNGHDIWLGLGAERIVIAWLSRVKLLVPLQAWVGSWLNRFS